MFTFTLLKTELPVILIVHYLHNFSEMLTHNCIETILKLCMLGKHFSRQHFEIFIFNRKLALTFHANCLLRRQFAWNVKANFLQEKTTTKKKQEKIVNLSSAELAQRVFTEFAQRVIIKFCSCSIHLWLMIFPATCNHIFQTHIKTLQLILYQVKAYNTQVCVNMQSGQGQNVFCQ